MAKNKSSVHDIENVPGEGDVAITIDGEDLFLRPSLSAALGISRLHNDLNKTMQYIMNMDLDTIVSVVSFGLSTPVTKKLQEQVWRSGVFAIRTPLIRFLSVINNGGRLPKDDDEDETEEDENENPTETDQAL